MALRNLGAALSRLSLSTIARGSTSASAGLHRDHISSLPFTGTTATCSISSCMTSSSATSCTSSSSVGTSVVCNAMTLNPQIRKLTTSAMRPASLRQMHRTGPIKKIRKNKNPLVDRPFARGVVLKTVIKKPKKPNSANRKCVLVRLTTGREMIAYVPGEGHNLQEHNIVLVRPGRLQDVPGVKLKCVRGKYDLQHVIKKVQ
ncbi:40S ribosomal protein S12, mitochondrial-like isoform X2 [Homarus americanus]|nr:40S ribosomal protein S12, mitochondrial-like isoform X2 [Homarus americanus]XP_042232727.1 40S ribosomal protein S12, mitochondrial-like isoform X2 [Homarus americanus]